MNSMRDVWDWVIPVMAGGLLGLLLAAGADALGWSSGAQGSVSLIGVLVAVWLRFVIHDYAGDAEARRQARQHEWSRP